MRREVVESVPMMAVLKESHAFPRAQNPDSGANAKVKPRTVLQATVGKSDYLHQSPNWALDRWPFVLASVALGRSDHQHALQWTVRSTILDRIALYRRMGFDFSRDLSQLDDCQRA